MRLFDINTQELKELSKKRKAERDAQIDDIRDAYKLKEMREQNEKDKQTRNSEQHIISTIRTFLDRHFDCVPVCESTLPDVEYPVKAIYNEFYEWYNTAEWTRPHLHSETPPDFKTFMKTVGVHNEVWEKVQIELEKEYPTSPEIKELRKAVSK